LESNLLLFKMQFLESLQNQEMEDLLVELETNPFIKFLKENKIKFRKSKL